MQFIHNIRHRDPVIVCGDFNTKDTNLEYQLVFIIKLSHYIFIDLITICENLLRIDNYCNHGDYECYNPLD